MTNIAEVKTRLGKEIRQKRAEINKLLDNLEKQIIKDLEEKEYQSKKSIQNVLSSVKEKETMVTQCQITFLSIKQYASNLQTFLGINEIEVKVYENEQYLQSLKEANSLEQIGLVWKVDPVSETISKFFGSIEMTNQTSSLGFISSKNKQAQIQVVTTKKTSINDVKLILQKEITIYGQHTKGCCMSKEGDFLFTVHFFQKSLITIGSKNKLKHKMKLGPSYGFDITLIDETTIAISDGNSGKKFGIDIIDIKNQRKINFIELPGRTWGIARDHDSLFVCVDGRGIYKVNTSDYITSHVISCNLPMHSYVAVFSDKIYYTNPEDNSVVCYDENGSRVWTFQDELILNEPEGMTVDKNGNVYVVGFGSNNVIIISSDGKHHKQVLPRDNGLSSPSAIFLDAEKKKLLVANTEKTAFVYNISCKLLQIKCPFQHL
ncbi:uncharacterized protein LOC134692362 [Mytilus trossulus]|uniref:uncharacterized protein LOC134692362 n=1 Tax=Mytilus trossulus TaxID=6551 RepID=UPI003003BAC9